MILDRYVVRRYVGKLIWAITASVVVFLAVDMVEMLDKFIDSRVPMTTVFRYYYLYLPYIVYLILPVATLLGTLFTIGGLTMSNELSAMQVSGVPFARPLTLLLLVTSLMVVLGFFLGETVVPPANRKRMDIYRYEVKRLPREARAKGSHIYMQIDQNKQISVDRYNTTTREAYGIQVVDIYDGRIVKRADAEKMVWINDEWHLQGAVNRVFGDEGSVNWSEDIDLTIYADGLRPDEMENVQIKPEEMNWSELKTFISRLRETGGTTIRWEVDLLFKVSLPTAAVVIVLFGAPIAAVRRRGGTVLGFGLALFICFIYFGFMQVGKVLGYSGILTPLVSAWIGNIFFGSLGLGIMMRWAR